MYDRHQICPVNQDYEQRKSRSGTKTMNLGPFELSTSKQDTIEYVQKSGATRATNSLGITPRVRSNLNKNKFE
jgi:hypothetical protein